MAGAAILPPPPADPPGPDSGSRDEAPTSERPPEAVPGGDATQEKDKRSRSPEERTKRPVEGPGRERDRSRDRERPGDVDRGLARVRESDRERDRSRERGRDSRDSRERGSRDLADRLGERERRPDKHRPPSGRGELGCKVIEYF